MLTPKSLSFTRLRKLCSDLVQTFPETRVGKNVQISSHDIVMSALACMFYQDASLLQFQRRLASKRHRSNLHSQFGLSRIPKESQMKVVLDQIPSQQFEILFKQLFHRLQRAKYLKAFESPLGGYLCALDGTQYYWSSKVRCKNCLKFNKKTGVMWSHRVVQAALVHPEQKTVIPFMPMEISNDYQGQDMTQDNERRGAHRLIESLKRTHCRLPLTLLGDALYAEQPCIRLVKEKGYHFIFTVKPNRHRYLYHSIEGQLQEKSLVKKGKKHTYRWAINHPLTHDANSEQVNYISYTIASPSGGAFTKQHILGDG